MISTSIRSAVELVERVDELSDLAGLRKHPRPNAVGVGVVDRGEPTARSLHRHAGILRDRARHLADQTTLFGDVAAQHGLHLLQQQFEIVRILRSKVRVQTQVRCRIRSRRH